MERISTFFTNNGTPAIGLSPIIDIWQQNGDKVVTNGVLIGLGGCFYAYDFALYNMDKVYLYQIDGGSSLTANERYKFGNNELDSYSFKYSYGRTAIPTQNYTPNFDKIEKKFSEIKGYDDTEVKNILWKLEKSLNTKPKKEENELIPVLTVLQNQINDIKNLIGGINTESGILSLGESLKVKFIEEMKVIEKSITKILESMGNKLNDKLNDGLSTPVKELGEKLDEKVSQLLAEKIPENIKNMYDVIVTRKKDKSALDELEKMEIDDENVLKQLEEMVLDNND